MAIHRTAMGKSVDMSALSGQHEKTRAVSNLNMNARGDIVDSHNQIVQDSTRRVKASYDATVNPTTGQVPSHLVPPSAPAPNSLVADTTPIVVPAKVEEVEEPIELTEEEKELFESDEDEEDTK
jgi:hypothetical protein